MECFLERSNMNSIIRAKICFDFFPQFMSLFVSVYSHDPHCRYRASSHLSTNPTKSISTEPDLVLWIW
ncbi:hypothetical protein Scep_020355 [Stephania cephalantha]|uniref:Uncharacterized protein n=1 Tax=Stephania cephalantha TaxID=152367 RepID=A0AAP0ICG5_9MAGN